MLALQATLPYICARCVRAPATTSAVWQSYRSLRQASSSAPSPQPTTDPDDPQQDARPREEEAGALSQRLAQLSEEALESSGRSAQRTILEDAGVSEDLKRRLEEKIAAANFRNEHASAFAEANLPSSAGRGTRDLAGAQPWTGNESVEDTAFRMLTDAHKPLRAAPGRGRSIRGPPVRVDVGQSGGNKAQGTGTRLANARDRSSTYSYLKDPNMSEEERQKFRAELKARFDPGARRVPATMKGLASLANERIEDAIARGQFKNIPRGKKIERDYNASSPFIDTTEYFMNKMIQKQEIVPPWIEKQQELVSTALRFRRQLRADWRRHVSRSIASRGGSLAQQMKMAEEYAYAESYTNPPKEKVEQLNATDDAGHVSQITLAGELKPSASSDESPELDIQVVEQVLDDEGNLKPTTSALAEADATAPPRSTSIPEPRRQPTVPPFRDPQWEQAEASYLRTAVDNLNNLTRSYNLMAPDLAKKPYFSLDRELKACFADVAPTVAAAIQDRALAPKIRGVEIISHTPGGVLEKFAMDRAAHVYDERKPQYGFREFWRDLFASKST